MNSKPNSQELEKTGSDIGIEIKIMDNESSEHYIRKVTEKLKPFKVTGHLGIGVDTLIIPLEENEFSYSKKLKSESAYIFFDQEGRDRNSVVIVKDAKSVGYLMENSFGMEYFVSNVNCDYLISVNWYVIEIAGSAKEFFKALN